MKVAVGHCKYMLHGISSHHIDIMDLPRHGSKFNSMLDPSEGGAMGEFHARVKEHHSCHSAIGIL